MRGALTNLGLALTLTGNAKEGIEILKRAQALDDERCGCV